MAGQGRQGGPPGTHELLASRCLERLSGSDACRWAVSALEAGFDTPALRILAGMAFGALPNFLEVRPYLDAALGELNVVVDSSRDDILRGYARHLAEELLAGARPVAATLEAMHQAVVSPLNHAEDLMGWCYLWEGLAPNGTCEVTGKDLDRAARDFAAHWLSDQPA
jgi:hypothetical protein